MRKTDINQFAGTQQIAGDRISTPRSVWRMFLKGLLTLVTILAVTGLIVLVSVVAFIYGLKDSSVDYDLHKLQLNYTSFIYVNGPNDDSAHPVKYSALYSSENRIWVDYDKIPAAMKDAIVAIEDKRFWEHNGVDWQRTVGATANLFNLVQTSGGGSTITQQLIKNITGENEVSLTRKVKEIFRAINLEKKYSKEEILTAYLNVVNFGSGCNGVQAAANLYFGKNIQDCDIAQCAAIAGITRNPTAYNPLSHPEANKERQQTVLKEMYNQGKISDAQYKSATQESEHMTFVGKKTENVVDENSVWNWYVDTMFEDVKEGLMQTYGISSDKAVDMLYHDGLNIYCAMDTGMQGIAENVFNDGKTFPAKYANLQGGYVAMDYSGRVLAVVGSRGKKTSNRLYNFATDAKRQPGSSIKPLAEYAPAVNMGKINYSSLLNDEPIENWKDGKPGPANWDKKYHGNITVELALDQSYNAAAVQLCKTITPNVAFNFLKQKLSFTSLEPSDNTLSMAIGGLTQGATVMEMTSGYQMFGNGGKFYKPYTFYYVTDHDGNVINGLDNRNEIAAQAISSSAATIMNKLLTHVVTNGLGSGANISGWNIFGKTGTTNDNKDSWFVGGSPYAVAGVWTGYKTPKTLSSTYETPVAKKLWKNIMSQYLKDKQKKNYSFDPNVVSAVFCKESGLLANPGVCTDTGVGWYEKDSLPATCNLDHGASSASSVNPDSSLNPASGFPESSSEPESQTESSPNSGFGGSSSAASEPSSSPNRRPWTNGTSENQNPAERR